MRFPIILLFLLFSFNSFCAVDDKSMQDLLKNYESVMIQKKIDLIDEVFTAKFIRSSGGKEKLIKKIKNIPVEKEKEKKRTFKWRKGLKGEIYFAKMIEANVKEIKEKPEFIILLEDGKLKIDGTISDAN